jgi:hypothetical protein
MTIFRQGPEFNREDITTWPGFERTIIAHDVGRSRDRSTAVVGGNSAFTPRLLGIAEFRELPQGLFGHARASALAAVDRDYDNNGLIVADLSNDASYAEVLYQTFGPRVIGLHVTRNGDGMNAELRRVANGAIPVYPIGRSHLLELFHRQLVDRQVKMKPGSDAQRAMEQLTALETEYRDTGTVYSCPPGQHDDLAMSCAMLAWAATHPHLDYWSNGASRPRRPAPKPQSFGWPSFV